MQNPSIFKNVYELKKHIDNYKLSNKYISSKISTLKPFQQGEKRWWYCRVISEMLEICNRKPVLLRHSVNWCSEGLLLGVVTNQNCERNIIDAEVCKKDRFSFLDFFNVSSSNFWSYRFGKFELSYAEKTQQRYENGK